MPPRVSSTVEDLIQWSTINGSYLDPKVEIYLDHNTGWSFRAKEDIAAGINIVNCSYETTLSFLNAIESGPHFNCHGSQPFLPEALRTLSTESPHIVGKFFLIQQYLLGPSSFWWPYISLLPQPDEAERLGIPMWWSDADLMFLQGTNAQPTVKAITNMWYKDWQMGYCLIANLPNSSAFTYLLYKWAASIFATRSFRASLTIPQDLISVAEIEQPVLLTHLQNDNFSVLLPVMDIGNHNGINEVEWKPDIKSGFISLANLNPIERDVQIYNFYGEKSNSELLLGYGFVLPNFWQDTVNLKLTPSSDALNIRRSQACYRSLERKSSGQEFIFQIHPSVDSEDDQIASAFSPGLIDLLSCMVANQGEKKFLSENPTCCLEHDSNMFQKMAGRIAIQTWLLLCHKLKADIARVTSTARLLSYPKNCNQKLALYYRTRQLDVLQAAHRLLSGFIEQFCHHNTFLLSSSGPISSELKDKSTSFELLPLESAYEWLRKFPEVYDKTMHLISTDQAEPLPLDWAILLADWDRTYWIVWILIVSLLQDAASLASVNLGLSAWLRRLDESYQYHLETHNTLNIELECDQSELETIEYMSSVWKVIRPETSPQNLKQKIEFAAFVTQNHTVVMEYKMLKGSCTGKALEQKVLCINLT